MDDSGKKGFIWMTYAVLILVVVLSTCLRHFQPQALSIFVFWFVIAGGIASMQPYQLPSGW